jgi:PPP family 3-phenylpropionic acid transporter
MPPESTIPIASHDTPRRFATRLALFYGTMFGMVGTHLPFFTVWLKAVGIDAFWIGIITAVPPVTRFTILPFLTALAERRHAVRGAIVVTAFATALGFCILGTQHQPVLVFLAYAVTCCLWTPMVPLTDAYALRGVARHGLNYGPLRLWGSAAFVAGALGCGLLVDVIAAQNLIWVIVSVAALGAFVGLGLQPLGTPKSAANIHHGAGALLRDPGFLAIIVTSALIQGSHAAYYIFASIAWQQAGLGGLTIAGLWSLGVIAEIVVFALSPRFTLPPVMLVVIAALSAVARWVITAQEPPLAISLPFNWAGLTFGLTQVGTMMLLVIMPARDGAGRGTCACSGIVSSSVSILSGDLCPIRVGVHYVMAALALSGAVAMWLARHRLADHPQSVGG